MFLCLWVIMNYVFVYMIYDICMYHSCHCLSISLSTNLQLLWGPHSGTAAKWKKNWPHSTNYQLNQGQTCSFFIESLSHNWYNIYSIFYIDTLFGPGWIFKSSFSSNVAAFIIKVMVPGMHLQGGLVCSCILPLELQDFWQFMVQVTRQSLEM